MTCRTADLCSPVTRAVEFIDWRSFKRIPGFRDAIVYVFVKERERGPGFEDEIELEIKSRSSFGRYII